MEGGQSREAFIELCANPPPLERPLVHPCNSGVGAVRVGLGIVVALARPLATF